MGRPGARWVALAVSLAIVASCSSGGDDDDGDSTPRTTTTSPSTESTAEPVRGGGLVVALEGEPDGLDPTRNTLTPAAMTYALAVYDPLFALDADGVVAPYLAESIEHDDDYLVWTIHLRAGVRFSDGTPLTAAAVVRVLEAHLTAELTRATLRDVESVGAQGDLTVAVHMKHPWVAFPVYLTGRLGLVPAPATLDDPDGAHHPIGTGPFVVRSWQPGDRMLLDRNPSYWRQAEGLPYLDTLELRPIEDEADRVDALADGRVDVAVSSEAGVIDALRDVKGAETAFVDSGPRDERTLVLNTATPPFDDVECRRAVAHAIDDDAAEADGCSDLSFTIRAGAADDLDAVVDALHDADIDATVQATDESTLAIDALLGQFEAVVWTTDAVLDPDQRLPALDARSSGPVGTLAVNLGRFVDEDVQTAFEAARAAPGKRRRAAFAAVDELLADRVPTVLLGTVSWAYGFDADIGGVLRGVEGPGGEVLTVPAGTLDPASLHRTTT